MNLSKSNSPRVEQAGAQLGSVAKLNKQHGIVFILGTIVVLLVIQLTGSPVWFSIVTIIAIYSIAAMSLTVLVGWAGQPSLLAGALMLVGGLCATVIPAKTPGSLLLSLVFSMIVGGVLGAIAALPSKRLTGTYLLLSTMALQFIVVDIANYAQSKSDKTGGYSLAHPNLFFFHVKSQTQWLWVAGIGVVLTYEYFIHLRHTRVGRSLAIIRDDASAASVAGINVRKHLTSAFIVTSAIISMAGALNAYYTQNVTYAGFDVLLSISFFVMIIIGGPGSLVGAVLGCAFVLGVPQVLPLLRSAANQAEVLPYIEQMIYGLIGLIVLVARFGNVPNLSRILHIFSTRFRSSSIEPALAGLGHDDGIPVSGTVELGGEVRNTQISSANGEVLDQQQTTPALLRLENLRVTYGGSVEAVRDINLTISEGRSMALVGPNGAGKTSTLLAVAGFPLGSVGRVTGGRVLLGTQGKVRDLNDLAPEDRMRLGIAFVSAEDKIFNELTVDEHLRLSSPRHAKSSEVELLKEEFFSFFPEVKPLLDRRAGLLSGGQRQQLALMCAFMRRPRVLIVDELSLGLSPVAIERVVTALLLIKSLGTTSLLLAEQNVSVAFAVSDSIVVMASGGVRSVGGPTEEYEGLVRSEFVGSRSAGETVE
jgi:branched-chain amino acid transport system permease protein